MMIADERHLLLLCEAYCRATGKSEYWLGDHAGGGQGFFGRLRRGKSCTIRVYRRALDWFATEWPETESWPAGVPRPKPTGIREAT